MALEPLADPAELARRVGAEADDPDVLGALASASADFRAAVHHPISRVTDDEVTIDGTGTTALLLPAFPVTVHSVTENGRALTKGTDYQASTRTGVLRRIGAVWADVLDGVVIAYDHGYDEIPDEITEVVLDAAEIRYHSDPGVSSLQVGGESVTYGRAATGTSEDWATVVRAYRIGRGDRA